MTKTDAYGNRLDRVAATWYTADNVEAALTALRIGEGDGGWTYKKIDVGFLSYEIHAFDEDGNLAGKF